MAVCFCGWVFFITTEPPKKETATVLGLNDFRRSISFLGWHEPPVGRIYIARAHVDNKLWLVRWDGMDIGFYFYFIWDGWLVSLMFLQEITEQNGRWRQRGSLSLDVPRFEQGISLRTLLPQFLHQVAAVFGVRVVKSVADVGWGRGSWEVEGGFEEMGTGQGSEG